MTSPTTTMKNREVFTRDPVGNRIPNGGVAKIGEPATQGEWDVLRYELSSFVCEGEYERGLETVLNTYLGNLGGGDQPAVWVSGFYGSGKSHLVRVLEFLWRDMEFSDGATARSVAQLPDTVREKLRELDTVGRRGGGLWSAAGTLGAGAGESVRLAILGIIFEGSGLPKRYAQGRFVLWLMQSGFYEGVKAAVEAEGRNFRRELQNLYVSPHIARALLSVYPAFASGEKFKDSLREKVKDFNLKEENRGREVVEICTTFDKVIRGFGGSIADHDHEMRELLEDYEDFCFGEGLLPRTRSRMRAVPCGKTFDDNVELGLYYQPVDRSSRQHEYLGIYKQKRVRHIGRVEKIVSADLIEGELRSDVEVTRGEKDRIRDAIRRAESIEGYDIATGHKFYLVREFFETSFDKVSPGGLQGQRYFDLVNELGLDDEKQLPDVPEIAQILGGKIWR